MSWRSVATVLLVCASSLAVSTGSAPAQQDGLSLLGFAAPSVASGPTRVALPYVKAGDVERQMTYVMPAWQYEAGRAENVIVVGGRLQLAPLPGGGFAPSGSFESPVMVIGMFMAVLATLLSDVPDGTELEMVVRAFSNGVAGPWVPLGPEGNVNFGSTGDQLQYRLGMRSLNGTATPSAGELSLLPGAQLEQPLGSLAGPVTDVAAPGIIERAAWGAASPTSGYTNGPQPNTIVVHHTENPSSTWAGASSVRGIQQFHQNGNHWSDIGYHFIVGPDGTIYRGRPELAVGAHAPPNEGRLGISLFGKFMVEAPSNQAFDSLKRLVAHLSGKYGIGPGGIVGHRDVRSTDCPGTNLYSRLGELRQAAGGSASVD